MLVYKQKERQAKEKGMTFEVSPRASRLQSRQCCGTSKHCGWCGEAGLCIFDVHHSRCSVACRYVHVRGVM